MAKSSAHTFVDEAEITAHSGAGGDGCVSFRREKFIARGGPDGGDGGRGGDVVLVGDQGMNTLQAFRHRREVRAGRGEDGAGRRRSGADGHRQVVLVPTGTLIYDADEARESARPLADLAEHGQEVVVARGGNGGWGNDHFKTPTRQAPDFANPGQPGTTRRLRLTLKLLADVGIIGFPNAGKSTLLSRISAAKPRVANYPFTTLVPSLGVVEVGERRFVAADVPGLIAGASEGAGLGDRFLRHIERTRVLVHLLDVSAMLVEQRDLVAGYDAIRSELGRYQAELLARQELVVINKVELLTEAEDQARADDVERVLRGRGCEVLRVSGATGEGLGPLTAAMLRCLDAAERAAQEDPA